MIAFLAKFQTVFTVIQMQPCAMEAAINFMENTMTPHVCHAKMLIVLGVKLIIKDVGNVLVDMDHLMVYVLLVMIPTV